MISSDGSGWAVAVALDQPVFVVGALEFEQGLAQGLDRFEPADPEQVFLEGADKAFGAAIAFGCANERR